MKLLCPSCRTPVELTDPDRGTDTPCPACGSSVRPAGGSTTGWSDTAGRRVGRFELIDTLGAGAFGTVYKARDPDLDRIVAVKVPRAGGLATDAERDRFFREARSAARLRHPGVVSVHEVGADGGVPFLVSDLVEGVTLADLLTGRQPAPAEAAGLVAAVADALHYAHAEGVVHRDVKPSNVMIRPDGTPVVMDFGLARRDGGEATMTADGQVLGTPAYMSPEQARGDAHWVDGRSDVYSLGVILYQLLTGELPFRGNARMLLHQVLHDEPRPPRRLNDRIPRDLETVCLTAMRKEPGRRYATAAALADDLRRFHRGEPVLARPVGRAEKAWRWCRRNPAVAGLLAALAAALTGGLAATTWLWLRAEDRRHRAELAERAADEHRQRADRSYRLAREALDQSFEKVKADPRLRQGPLEDLRRVLLRSEVEFFHKFADLQGDDPRFRAERASALFSLARATRELGSVEEAAGHYRQAVAAFAELAREDPSVPAYRADLAQAYNNLAVLSAGTGRPREAEEAHAEAIRLQQALVAAHPDKERYQVDLARSYLNLGNIHQGANRLRDAERVLRQALDVPRANGRDGFATPAGRAVAAKAHLNLGIGYHAANDFRRAEDEFVTARGLFEELSADQPENVEHRDDLSKALNNLGELYRGTGRLRDAEAAFEQSAAIHRELVRRHPTVAEYRADLATRQINLALLANNLRQPARAEERLNEAVSVLEGLAKEHPTVADYRADLAMAHAMLGETRLAAGQTATAEADFRRALELREALAREQPGVPEYRRGVAAAQGSLAAVALRAGRPAAADAAFREALAVFVGLSRDYPQVSGYTVNVAVTQAQLGKAAAARGKPAAALPWFALAAATLGWVLDREPRHRLAREMLRNVHLDRAQTLMDLARHAEAVADWDRSLDLDDGRHREHIRQQRAMCHFAREDHPRALAEADGLAGTGTATGLYRAACLYAEAVGRSAGDTARADRHGVKAVELLRQAVGKGFMDYANIRKNPDLDPLRGRADFRAFVAGLPATPEKGGP